MRKIGIFMSMTMAIALLVGITPVQAANKVQTGRDYERVWSYSEGMAIVRDRDGRLGFVDKNGREVNIPS
ncbi:hypothetical protein ACFQMJ_07010 [Cohnella cellulosilytica]|uniref:WG repeat-containing protein n=2 Tax=Cohnella cellulosilytica TaxID=986710 RepID=A0ABW2F864_9BACL